MNTANTKHSANTANPLGNMDSMLNRVVRVGLLYDFYEILLTEKQKKYLNMHYLQDLSLAEIAEHSGTSRQAVHDILRRAEQMLEEYETKLALVQKYQKNRIILREINFLLNNLLQNGASDGEIETILEKLKELDTLGEDLREV